MNKSFEKLNPGFGFGGIFTEISSVDEPLSNQELSIDEYWMTEAIKESLRSVGISNPNPAVGCVIVKDGIELARGQTEAYGGLLSQEITAWNSPFFLSLGRTQPMVAALRKKTTLL